MNLKHTLTALLALTFAAGCGDKDAATDSAATDDSTATDDSAVEEGITFTPSADTSLAAGGGLDLSIGGLDEATAYRVTLVIAANLTTSGDGTGTFIDGDANGAADAGASEAVALIASVNGAAITAAKTYPSGEDDPANPSGIFPVTGGVITVNLSGVAAGTVYPVIYVNGGASTFLEITGGVPSEVYAVGPAITVN
ncbi:MAG: hypothetical protein IPO67_27070 [Deltaproteobacteria bacterium]|nr:hypothetical protein [Deltaproteobacteria bacterium]